MENRSPEGERPVTDSSSTSRDFLSNAAKVKRTAVSGVK